MKLYRFISLELHIILSDEFVERHGSLNDKDTKRGLLVAYCTYDADSCSSYSKDFDRHRS